MKEKAKRLLHRIAEELHYVVFAALGLGWILDPFGTSLDYWTRVGMVLGITFVFPALVTTKRRTRTRSSGDSPAPGASGGVRSRGSRTGTGADSQDRPRSAGSSSGSVESARTALDNAETAVAKARAATARARAATARARTTRRSRTTGRPDVRHSTSKKKNKNKSKDKRRRPSLTPRYDLSLVRAEPDLAALTERIAAVGRRRLGILLDGPPGSGKSEYAKQLAKRMDLKPLPKRASDLVRCWVGETEQRIAAAFEEARKKERFLIIDEADSFLADRSDAYRNWEVRHVNEMLSQLEEHDLPYAFTTNLADHLDPAAARRFLFRATFRFLDPPRVRRAWEFFFPGEAPDSAARLRHLVPSDFVLVRERAEILGFLDDPAQLAAELETEARSRGARTPIGF